MDLSLNKLPWYAQVGLFVALAAGSLAALVLGVVLLLASLMPRAADPVAQRFLRRLSMRRGLQDGDIPEEWEFHGVSSPIVNMNETSVAASTCSRVTAS